MRAGWQRVDGGRDAVPARATPRLQFGRQLAALAAAALAVQAAQGVEPADAFRARCAALAAEGTGMTVAGRDGWLFLRNELRHIGAGAFWGADAEKASQATKPEWRDPLPAIVDYRKRLAEAGIELLVLPVPAKAFVYPDRIEGSGIAAGGAVPRLDATHQEFLRLLKEQGVKVLDLWPDLAAHRDDAGGGAYCRTDTHWSGAACVRAAAALASEIRARDWFTGVPKTEFAAEEKPVTVEGDLLRGLEGASKPPPETLTLRFVGRRTAAGLEPVEPDAASPVLLLADSHGLVFHAGDDMLARGAGLADQMALELGFAPDLVAVRGSGATPARVSLYRKAKADPAYLKSKKLVVWCFAAREFTETTGWSTQVPVVPK